MKLNHLILTLIVLMFAGCTEDKPDPVFFVNQTNKLTFPDSKESSAQISLRTNRPWRVVIPDDASWLSTEPSEGTGTMKNEFITITAQHNRGDERTGVFYLEVEGEQHPVTITQADGNIRYSIARVEGSLQQGIESAVTITVAYTKASGDETVSVSGTATNGLQILPTTRDLTSPTGEFEIPVSGTPVEVGAATVTLAIDGKELPEQSLFVRAEEVREVEGLPVSWQFHTDASGSTDINNALMAAQPMWGEGAECTQELFSTPRGAIIKAMSSDPSKRMDCVHSKGNPAIRSMQHGDYLLFTIPVKNLDAGTEIELKGCIAGTDGGVGIFTIQYSEDGEVWTTIPGLITEFSNYLGADISYHFKALSTKSIPDAHFTIKFAYEGLDIPDGNLYLRYLVSADLNIKGTGKPSAKGSNRLIDLFSVAVAK